jgi:AraC-like DNA-binding protein
MPARRASADFRRLAALPPSSPRRFGQLLLLLGGLADRPGDCRALAHAAGAQQPSALVQRQIARAIAYLEAHWRGRISQRHAACICGQSPSAFAEAFRRWTGRTFMRYVADMRLGGVCRALTGGERPIGEIAAHCGFGTLSGFNRRFRAHARMAPGANRHASRGAMPEPGRARRLSRARVAPDAGSRQRGWDGNCPLAPTDGAGPASDSSR